MLRGKRAQAQRLAAILFFAAAIIVGFQNCSTGFGGGSSVPTIAASSPTTSAAICSPNATQLCQVGSGLGSQTCNTNGTAWNSCGNVTGCLSGYNLKGGICVPVNPSSQCVTPYDYGAIGDGVKDDTAALQNAINASVASKSQAANCLYLPGASKFLATSTITINMPANSSGPVIYGAGALNSKIVFSTPNTGLVFTSSTAMFYGDISNFSVVCNTSGACVTLSLGVTDAANGFNISNLVVNNSSTNASSIGVQMNGIYTSNVFLTSNCNGHGTGTGVQISAGGMNTFKIAAGNCNIGLQLTNNVDDVGGNVFTNDLEVNSINLQIDGSAAQRNTFIGGVYSMYYAGDIGINATAGAANEFINPNWGGAGTFCSGVVGISFPGITTPTGCN